MIKKNAQLIAATDQSPIKIPFLAGYLLYGLSDGIWDHSFIRPFILLLDKMSNTHLEFLYFAFSCAEFS